MATATKEKKKKGITASTVSTTKNIPLTTIFANTAQSRGMGVVSNLQTMGYGLFEKPDGATYDTPIWQALTGNDPEAKQHMLVAIEQYEPGLVALAEGLGTRGQLQPIGVFALKDGGYDVIYGMRRALATAFYRAKHKQDSGEIEAKIFEGKLSPVDLKLMALDENDNRQEESPIDRAMTYSWLKDEHKMGVDEIGEKTGQSGQNIRNYLKLLSPLLENKRLDIHTGKLPVDRALKLLQRLKEGENGEARAAQEGKRYRLPSVKRISLIYNSKKRPRKISDKEWQLWCSEDVRRLLAHYLGFKFTPFKGDLSASEEDSDTDAKTPAKPSANGETPAKGKTLIVKRKRAQDLLVSLGKVNARNWEDKTLKEKLENIVNLVEPGQKAENESLQKLLDKLVSGYSTGLKVEITAEK